MARRKMKKGQCKLCQQEKSLNFEHVPPRSAFNKSTRYISVPSEIYTSIDNPLSTPPKGKVRQGGTGYYAFCEECNNFLGLNYVKPYEHWAKIGLSVLKSTNKNSNYYEFIAKNIEPQRILKQIISMFIAMNDNWYFKEYPELIDFVAKSATNYLPNRYRVFFYLHNEGQMRHRSHTVISTPDYGILNCTELSFPPFGYVLTFDFDGDIEILTEITTFKDHPAQKETELYIGALKHPTYIPLMPLDYRTKEEIEKSIQQGIEIKNKASR
jgi:hypothetical protein